MLHNKDIFMWLKKKGGIKWKSWQFSATPEWKVATEETTTLQGFLLFAGRVLQKQSIYMFYSDKHYSETKHSGGSIMLSEHFLLKESWNWNQSSCSNKVYHQGELFLFFLSPLIMGNHDRVLDGSAACKWMGPKGHLDFTDSTIIKEYMEALDETFIEEQTKTRCVWKANTVTLVSLSINL